MKLFRKFLILCNIICALCFLLAWASTRFSDTFFWLVYFGVGGVYLFVVNLLFIIYWLLKKDWWFLLSAITLVLFWGVVASLFQLLNLPVSLESEGDIVKVLSSNVGLFGAEVESNKNDVLDLCKEEKPDIVCFQEFQSSRPGSNDINDKLFEAIGYKSGYFERTRRHHDNLHSGICIFSKWPIIKKKFYQFDQRGSVNAVIYVDVDRGKDTLRIFNVHLQSIRLQPSDYHYLDDLDASRSQRAEGIKEILGKLKRGVTKRVGQADMVAKLLRESPYPIVLCGDFNAPPSSYAYHQLIKQDLQDSFREKGFGVSATYAGPLPFNRIDYILCSDGFEVLDHRVLEEDYSDHYPVVASIRIGE